MQELDGKEATQQRCGANAPRATCCERQLRRPRDSIRNCGIYQRLKFRCGGAVAKVAIARKLAERPY